MVPSMTRVDGFSSGYFQQARGRAHGPDFGFSCTGVWLLLPGMPFPLIVGLGNPGRQYDETRHNVGFMLLDRLAAAGGAVFGPAPKWQCHLAKLPECGTLLVKPQTFMNLSGRAIQQVLAWHKWPPESMLVIYDDASLPLGMLRFREKGSAGGHNGIKSIIQHLGTEAFPRLKIGIGSSMPGNMTGHVLGKFSPDEQPLLENTLATALDAVQLALSQGIAAAANRYHSPNPSPTQQSDEPQIPRNSKTRARNWKTSPSSAAASSPTIPATSKPAITSTTSSRARRTPSNASSSVSASTNKSISSITSASPELKLFMRTVF